MRIGRIQDKKLRGNQETQSIWNQKKYIERNEEKMNK